MFGLNKEKKEELISIGYNAGELLDKSKKVIKEGSQDEKLDRILKNQVFLLKILRDSMMQLE